MNICLRKIYILFVTQTFSEQKNISPMRYIFFTFSYIYFSEKKKVFFSKKIFQCKTFFHKKTFFSASNVH